MDVDSADESVAERVKRAALAVHKASPLLVAIDGRSAAGKSTFAATLADAVRAAGRPVLLASIDTFHTPGHKFRSIAEEYTPESYYERAFDYARFREWVIDPLLPGGNGLCRLRYWNSYADEPYADPPVAVAADSVVIIEGGCLMRPEFDGCWDMSMWLDIDWEQMVERAVERDVVFVGDPDVVRRRYEGRFRGVHTLYEEQTRARDRVDIVIDNRDPRAPTVVRGLP